MNNQKINCENEFCIYQQNGKCMLEEVDIENNGACVSAILVNIDENFLKNLKKKQLEKMEKRFK